MTRLRTLLNAMFLGLALIPLLTLGAILGLTLYKSQIDSAYQSAKALSTSVGIKAEDILGRIVTDVRSITRYKDFFSVAPRVQRDLLMELLASVPSVLEITYAGPDGRQRVKVSDFKVYSLDDPQDLSARPEFAEALRSRSIACGPIETDPDIGEPLLPLAIALNDLVHGEVKAVMLCKVRLRVFLNLVQEYSQPPNVQVLITGLDNRVLAATDFSKVLAGQHFSAANAPSLRSGIDGKPAVSVASTVEMGRHLLNAVAVVSSQEALAPFFKSMRVYGIILILTLAAATLLAVLSRRRIVTPIQTLTDTAISIQAGELAAQAPGGTFYETQKLAEAFNSMTGQLVGAMNKLKEQIAGREKAQQELAASRERLDMALNAVSDGIWDWRLDTGEVYYSPRWFTMLGYQPEAFPGKYETWKNLLHPEDVSTALEIVGEHLVSGDPFEAEVRMLTSDGGWKWILSRGQVMEKDAQGRALRILGTHMDITERKRADEFILESKARYRRIVENSADGIFLADLDGNIVDVNSASAKLLGYTREELLDMNVADIDIMMSSSGFKQSWEFSPDEQAQTIYTEHKCKDGTIKDVEVRACRFVESDNVFVLGLVRDVTQRKKTEEALKKSQNQLANAVRIAKLGHWELDVEQGQFTFSDSFYSIFHTNAEEMGGYVMSIQDYANRFIHPDDRFMVDEEVKKAIISNDPEHRCYLEHRFVTADGQTGHLAVNYHIVKDSSGKTVRTYGVNQDITNRVLAEEALRESEIRFKALHNASFGGIAVHDKGLILECNLGLSEMFGYTQDELIGMDGLLLMAEKSRDKVMSRILSGSEKPYEAYGLRKNGEEFPLRLEARSIPYKGKMVRAVEIRDITEERNAAQALMAAKEAAEAATRAKSEFLANMSHEVRTPLNGVLGMLQLLQTTEQTDEQKEYVVRAIKSTSRLTRLLADILDISRIEAGKFQIIEEEFSLSALKESIHDLFMIAAKEKRIEFAFTVDPTAPPRLIGDETRVRQILFNLAGNAIKFTEHGSVRIQATLLPSKDGQAQMLFMVRDTGIGISDEQLKDIFEPFVQGEESYTRRYQGAGLGLSIVRKLVKLQGGELAIDNTPGEGTLIYLSLPFKLPLSQKGPVGALRQPNLGSNDRPFRILFADDDEISLISGKKLLEKSGYDVLTAKDGQEALNRLSEQDFDLILMDIQMPVMDGVAAAKAIRTQSPFAAKSTIPIIAMTAYAMVGDREKFLAAGMDGYISKPVDMIELREVINRVRAKLSPSTS
ncbi:MAG: PAS domain S-box [Solidesulfovibrio magneticus str. Maddingley MBC34]|uniref:Sensory/regulatory protein RpfC n=1 Tax=Solidesulfovibrio magneticus str. Maddingley MBC34 TaxID=1206767 RepID=K6HB81_9BACT|nr:MAG: PAS domain S-box [Solidesulfovibrio magneticus str. Maddingley MBC34]